MTFTYSSDPSTSTRNKVRFLINDVDSADALFNDAELDYLIAEWVDVYEICRAACETLAARFNRLADSTSKSVGDISVSESYSSINNFLTLNIFRFCYLVNQTTSNGCISAKGGFVIFINRGFGGKNNRVRKELCDLGIDSIHWLPLFNYTAVIDIVRVVVNSSIGVGIVVINNSVICRFKSLSVSERTRWSFTHTALKKIIGKVLILL